MKEYIESLAVEYSDGCNMLRKNTEDELPFNVHLSIMDKGYEPESKEVRKIFWNRYNVEVRRNW